MSDYMAQQMDDQIEGAQHTYAAMSDRIAEIEKNAHIEIARQRSENAKLDMRIAELEAALRDALETIKTTDNALRLAWDKRTLPADAIPSTVPQMAKASIAAIENLLKD